jgi:hypothetical protein
VVVGGHVLEEIDLVFSRPPSDFDTTEYDRWYDAHLAEILATPGFVAARRYRLEARNGRGTPADFPYLSLYEVEGELRQLQDDLTDEQVNMALPEWFDQITFRESYGVAIGGGASPILEQPDHLYLVFTSAPPDISSDVYGDWYANHVDENVANSPEIRAGRMFRIEDDPVRGMRGPSHLAMYELTGAPEAMLSGLNAKVDRGEIVLPEWFERRISVGGIDATAIGTRATA